MGDYVRHFRGQPNFCIHLKTSKKHFDAFKYVHESVLAFPNVLHRLRNVCVTIAHAKLTRIHTERRIPIPAKTTVAGENDCEIDIRLQVSDEHMSYQANSSNCLGESKEYVYGGIEPLGPSFIGTLGLI